MRKWLTGRTADRVDFFVDGSRVRTVPQSPGYPMQLMLGGYEFPSEDGPARPGTYPQTFVVDWWRVWQRPSSLSADSPRSPASLPGNR